MSNQRGTFSYATALHSYRTCIYSAVLVVQSHVKAPQHTPGLYIDLLSRVYSSVRLLLKGFQQAHAPCRLNGSLLAYWLWAHYGDPCTSDKTLHTTRVSRLRQDGQMMNAACAAA